jgi:tetrahydromethanopterin S-methyltransferase subunit H
MESLTRETGIPGMVALVANSLDEIKTYIDFIVEVTSAPFAIDIWMQKVRLAAARYAAELGLKERLLYNSITPWDEDIEGQVAELRELGIKHVVIQAFDMEDKGPGGRVKSLQKMLPVVEKGNFESILVDTAVMNLPFIAFSLKANRLIKQEFGLPAGCAPANGTYMWRKTLPAGERSRFPAVDAAIEAVAALESDFIFYGPMAGTDRVFTSVAATAAFMAAGAYEEGGPLPGETHPLNLLFPESARLLKEEGKERHG